MRSIIVHILVLIIILAFIVSCNTDYYPKPRGYFRIDLPEKEYILFDSTFPYKFEYPKYAKLEKNTIETGEAYWINLAFDQFKGKLYLSYKIIDNNLVEYLEDTHAMVMKHIPKANAIENNIFENEYAGVYGLTYSISGVGAASPFQFYVTDSTHHFLRGALYFNVVPNNDSLQPVIDFLIEDINHLIETMEWKDIIDNTNKR